MSEDVFADGLRMFNEGVAKWQDRQRQQAASNTENTAFNQWLSQQNGSGSPQPGGQPSPSSASGASGQPGPQASAAPVTASGPSTNMQTALKFYQGKGLSPLAASALVSGFGAESSPDLNTAASNPGDGVDGSASIGVAQWNGARAQGLRQYAAANNLDPTDLNTQLNYSWNELNGPERGTLAKLTAAQTPQDATAAALGYERPAGYTPQNPLGANDAQRRLASTYVLSNWAQRQQPQGASPQPQMAGGPQPQPQPQQPGPQPQQQGGQSPFGNLSGVSFPGAPQPAQAGAPPGPAPLAALAAGSGSGTPTFSSAPGAQAISAATGGPSALSSALGFAPTSTNNNQGGFPDISTPTRVSTDPRSPGTFPTPGVGGPPPGAQAATGQGQPYGSQPLNVNGQMLTRQQAEDTDGLDHSDYDAAAARAGLIRSPNAAPAFVDSPATAGGNQGASAAPAAPQPATAAQGGPASQQTGGQSAPPAPAGPRALTPLPGAGGVTPVGPRTTGVPADAIRTLLSNPDTAAVGMQLWQQAATGKSYGWVRDDVTGNMIRTDPNGGPPVVYPTGTPKLMPVAAGTSLVDPSNPTKALFTAPSDSKDAAPRFGVIGEDQYGRKQYGYPPAPGAAPGAAAPAPGASADSNLHGQDYLATLDPGMATQVQAIIDGRAAYPTGTQLSRPFGQALAAAVTQADPSFEAGNATARVKVRNEFESGGPSSPAGMITAGNTAIQHLGELSNDAEALQNSRLPPWNAVTNAFSSGSGGSSVTNFNTTLGHFVEEAVKFYRGSGGTEADVQRDMQNLNANMSPQQLHDAIQKNVALLQGKINALQDRWRQGMGPLVPDFPIVQPKSQAAISTIAKRAGVSLTNDAGGPQGQSQGSTQAGASPAAAQQGGNRTAIPAGPAGVALWNSLPSGSRVVDPKGVYRIKP